MFKWLGQQSENRKQKTKQLWGGEFSVVKEGLDERQVVAFVDNLIAQHRASQQISAASLRSVIEKAVADAEQIAATIKVQAQTEAEEEAARAINQARQEADEIRGKAELAAQKEAEDIISTSNKKAELAEVEARQKALLFLLRAREEIEREVRGDYKQAHSRLLSTLQNLVGEGQNIVAELKDKRERLWEGQRLELKGAEATLLNAAEVAVPPPETLAPTATQAERGIAGEEKAEESVRPQEEVPEEKAEEPVRLKGKASKGKAEEPVRLKEEASKEEAKKPLQLKPEDSQALYVGEVDLAISVPVELKVVSKFYNYLQTISDIKILRTTGSWDRGTTITLVADKPVPLVSTISKVPGVEVIAGVSQKDGSAKQASGLRLRTGGEGVKRIELTLKEA